MSWIRYNFVLELALLQEQIESCRKILEFAETERINLIIPAYCLIEPYEVQYRREKNRRKFSEELSNEFNQLSRSQSYKDQKETFEKIIDLLITSQEEEKSRLDEMITKLTRLGETINLTNRIITEGVLFQKDLDLSPQDSFVYASVRYHLEKSEKKQSCFISRDSKDFNDPDIVEELDRKNCKMLFSFEDGMGFIKSVINSE